MPVGGLVVIVRPEAEGWTLIRQNDHAIHCGAISRAWRNGRHGDHSVGPSLEKAATEHDLGWVDTDSKPRVDTESGAPLNFTLVSEADHTDFYTGAVRHIAASDPYAAYLVSLHASGLYNRRFGWNGLKPVDWTSIGPRGLELLTTQRSFRESLLAELEAGLHEFEATWRNYMLLETFDFLSLATCLGFETERCGPVPTNDGQWTYMTVRRQGPFEVSLDPFPFAGSELMLEIPCVHLAVERFASDTELRSLLGSSVPYNRRTYYRSEAAENTYHYKP
jgi:Protein of unknown function (DUF3891)